MRIVKHSCFHYVHDDDDDGDDEGRLSYKGLLGTKRVQVLLA